MENLELIVALGRNNEIGCENRLLWPIREDLKHFKAVTMGRPVIMGRKTWESLPKKPLPGRLNVVVSSNPAYEAEGASVAASLAGALALARRESRETPVVIGGGRLYAEALPLCTRLHLTLVDAEALQADTWFPAINPADWNVESDSKEMTAAVDGHEVKYRFRTLCRALS